MQRLNYHLRVEFCVAEIISVFRISGLRIGGIRYGVEIKR
jgi:hypothetical protein